MENKYGSGVYKYDYTVYPDNSPEEFERICRLIERNMSGYEKRELLVDVDGSMIQVYENINKKIVVYDDYDVGAVFVRSDISLTFIPNYKEELISAHKCCRNHMEKLKKDNVCGCFYCLKIFSPKEIKIWLQDEHGDPLGTAICPYCGIDSVIGESSGFSITQEFLRRMERYWFNCLLEDVTSCEKKIDEI